jgi:glycosyltransferase involved in cell wall biosynthesis
MKICFLSYTHPFDDNRILYKEARSLAEAGFDVVHLAPGNGKSSYLHRVRIEIYPTGVSPLQRIKKLFRVYKMAIRVNADCYHCNEIESWLIGCLIKLIHRKKRIVFDIHEHYPSRFDEPHVPKGLAFVGKPGLRFLYRVLPRWTDYIIFAKRNIALDLPGNEYKQSFIFNYAPLWLASRQLKDVAPSIRREFNGCGKIAVHIGSFSRARGWPQLLQALSLIKNKHLELFCFGEIHEGDDILLAEAKRLGVADRLHLKQHLAYEQMFDYLLCADIGLMLYQPGIQNHVFAFPMKMYDYMLAALPVVGPDFAIEVAPVVRQESCGLLVNTAEPAEIAEALDWVCENPNLAKEMGKRGRQAIIDRYNWENEAKKLIQIYTEFER